MDDFVANVAKLSAFPERIAALVAPLTDTQLSKRPHGTDWSIKEHIGHLIDIDRVFAARIQLILAHEYQPFAQYSIDDVHRQGNYQHRKSSELCGVCAQTRHTTVALLHGLTSSDIMRIGVDSYFGEITLARLIEILVTHTQEHYDAMCLIASQSSAH